MGESEPSGSATAPGNPFMSIETLPLGSCGAFSVADKEHGVSELDGLEVCVAVATCSGLDDVGISLESFSGTMSRYASPSDRL